VATTLGARTQNRGFVSARELVADLVCVLLVALTVCLSYRFSSRVITLTGETGTALFLRLSSFILLCVGVSIVWSGIVDVVQPLLRGA